METMEIPPVMKAVRMYELGGSEVLKLGEYPVPKPKPNEVFI
jgi:NADPH:quinone reductase-like Zn-dependent oxidoreductase